MAFRRFVAYALVGLIVVAPVAAPAHGNTNFGGPLNGILDPASPTLQFTGTAAFAGTYNNAAAAAVYDCTATGPNDGLIPFGGPFSGTYTCVAVEKTTAPPSSVTGSFRGWTNLVTVAMSGDFATHAFNCEGALTVGRLEPGPTIKFGIAMACVIQ